MMWLYCTATVNRGSDDVYVCKSPTVQVYHVLKGTVFCCIFSGSQRYLGIQLGLYGVK